MTVQKAMEKFKEQWGRFYETAQKPCCCLFCKGYRVYWNGQRERTASVLIGNEVVYFTDILCKRVKCAEPKCKKSWTLRPPGLIPRRHYQICIVEHATEKFLFDQYATLTSVAGEHQCSRRTVGRWLNWISGIAEPSQLIHRVFHILKEQPFIAILKVSKILKKFVGTCKKVFRRTAKNFCLLQALGTVCRCEPPGFRGVIEAVICDRDRITTYHSPSIPELAR